MKNLETRDIIIVILFLAVLALGWATFFQGDSAYKERIKSLEKDNTELQNRRAALDQEIAKGKAAFDSLGARELQLHSELAALEAETRILRDDVQRSRENLETVRDRVRLARARIAELRDSPANRKADDLLNSLKIKTQK